MALTQWAKEKYEKYKSERAEEQAAINKANAEANALREQMRKEERQRALEVRLERLRNRPIEDAKRKEAMKAKVKELAMKAAEGAKNMGKGENRFGPQFMQNYSDPFGPAPGMMPQKKGKGKKPQYQNPYDRLF